MNATNERRPRKVDWPYVGGEPVMPGDTLWDAEGPADREQAADAGYEDGSLLRIDPSGTGAAVVHDDPLYSDLLHDDGVTIEGDGDRS